MDLFSIGLTVAESLYIEHRVESITSDNTSVMGVVTVISTFGDISTTVMISREDGKYILSCMPDGKDTPEIIGGEASPRIFIHFAVQFIVNYIVFSVKG